MTVRSYDHARCDEHSRVLSETNRNGRGDSIFGSIVEGYYGD
jgi:hypothetical protein